MRCRLAALGQSRRFFLFVSRSALPSKPDMKALRFLSELQSWAVQARRGTSLPPRFPFWLQLFLLLWIRCGYCIHRSNHRDSRSFLVFSVACEMHFVRGRPRRGMFCCCLFLCASATRRLGRWVRFVGVPSSPLVPRPRRPKGRGASFESQGRP